MRSRRNSITLVMTFFPPELLDLFVNISFPYESNLNKEINEVKEEVDR